MERTTTQKKQIDSSLGSFSAFFTAEELLKKVQGVKSKVGLATIYRFLKKKVESGELHSYQCDRRTIYSLDTRSHCHFHCEECGNISHMHKKDNSIL